MEIKSNVPRTGLGAKTLVIMALFIALSFVGSNIKVFGTIAFDSLPGFLAALLLGPFYGAAIGFLGHLFTAATSGFPFTVLLHAVIAATMAITMLGFGFTYKALKDKVSPFSNFIITGIAGAILNGPVSLACSMGTMALVAGKEAALGLLALLPALILASVANIAVSMALFKPLEKIWGKTN
jgi:uncharacterized membrane protein